MSEDTADNDVSAAARRLSLSKAKVPLKCAVCEKPLNQIKRGKDAYCSARCRMTAWRRREKAKRTAPND